MRAPFATPAPLGPRRQRSAARRDRRLCSVTGQPAHKQVECHNAHATLARPNNGAALHECQSSDEPHATGRSVTRRQTVKERCSPHRPPAAETLPSDLLRIDVDDYRNATALPPGRILVVGSGQSGCQIAEELHNAGRGRPRVRQGGLGSSATGWSGYLSVARRHWLPGGAGRIPADSGGATRREPHGHGLWRRPRPRSSGHSSQGRHPGRPLPRSVEPRGADC